VAEGRCAVADPFPQLHRAGPLDLIDQCRLAVEAESDRLFGAEHSRWAFGGADGNEEVVAQP
jgi:hypothetical protein